MIARDEILAYLEGQLLGPAGGVLELLPAGDPPSDRYLLGTLFPKEVSADTVFANDIVDDAPGEIGEDIGDDPIVLANQRMPSSLGLSLVALAPELRVVVEAARYFECDGGWHRHEFIETVDVGPTEPPIQPVLDGVANLHQVWRTVSGEPSLVTIALVNNAIATERRTDPGRCLYQVKLRVRAVNGDILPYPSSGSFYLDDESEELALTYRNRPAYAVGHGCATDWHGESGSGPSEVSTTYLPTQVVPDIDFSIEGFDDVTRMGELAHIVDDAERVLNRLRAFVRSYEQWIDKIAKSIEVPQELAAARQRILDRLVEATRRMNSGIEYLAGSDVAREAFAVANRAMQMQMRHSGSQYGGRRKRRNAVPYVPPDENGDEFAWRPFQLAYLLLTIEGASEPESPDRDVVDLIWFPTGGGKTEAYLGLVAYTIALRRIRLGDEGGGTTVITRYTLRLLTSQQFQRAATLICALELMRRSDPGRLGVPPIDIGIWLGKSASPNRFQEAVELLEQLKTGESPGRSFQLELCPWCGTELVPERPGDDEDYGIVASNTDFAMRCPSSTCPFHEALPVAAVDDALYEHPPTLLIATVDKFAQVVWKSDTGSFLGAGTTPGPDLIIQDELHLISGPLGTMVALYESAFDHVMSEHGSRPKVVASTATIRNADRHVLGVFGRRAFVFPPSGLNADDSYFVRFDESSAGRLFVGIMPQAHTPTTGLVRTAAALMQGPLDIGLTAADLDAYWTLVVYHNSLRELGKTVTLARDDIPARIELIAAAHDHMRSLEDEDDVIELTSNIPAYLIPRNLEILQRSVGEEGVASVVACTNMISVGVDVPRLGLMLIYGQPKTTSEYIQASSRVGRQTPGLIVTLYSAAKSRDRSHYETFRPYHMALYRQVEATSVTPFSLPARQRALHAALVILARYGIGPRSNDGAQSFDPSDPSVQALIESYLKRAAVIDPDEAAATRLHLGKLLAEWKELKAEARAGTGVLYYDVFPPHLGLLARFNDSRAGWTTPDSMRSVDFETLVKVTGERL